MPDCLICNWIDGGTRVVHATAFVAFLRLEPGYLLLAPKVHYDSLQDMPRFDRELFSREAKFWAAKLNGIRKSGAPQLGHASIVLQVPEEMDFTVARHIFVVEGTNDCGKDAFMSELRRSIADATEVLTHGFYLKLSRIKSSPSEVTDYCQRRLDSVLDMMGRHDADDFILSRFHLSMQVYGMLLTSTRVGAGECEDRLNELGAVLVLLDVSDKDVLNRRLQSRLEASEVPSYDMSPHLQEDEVWQLRNLYLEHFEESAMENKLYFDTAHQGIGYMREALCRQMSL